jgi:hypothetical protein
MNPRTEDTLGCIAAAVLAVCVLTTAVLLVGLATTLISYRPWMLAPFVGASFAALMKHRPFPSMHASSRCCRIGR